MTGRGVSDNDMPNFSWRTRRDASGIQDAELAALLAGGTPAADSRLRSSTWPMSWPRCRRRPWAMNSSVRRPRWPSSASGSACRRSRFDLHAGGLPCSHRYSAPRQLAHDTIGAPSPHASAHAGNKPDARHSGTPVGPNASGPAAFGLCTAYTHAKHHGTAAQKATAFRNLEKAAGGAANVVSFCAAIAHPGHSATPQTGAPTAHPSGPPTPHPTGKPSPHPTGKPSSHPTGPPNNA